MYLVVGHKCLLLDRMGKMCKGHSAHMSIAVFNIRAVYIPSTQGGYTRSEQHHIHVVCERGATVGSVRALEDNWGHKKWQKSSRVEGIRQFYDIKQLPDNKADLFSSGSHLPHKRAPLVAGGTGSDKWQKSKSKIKFPSPEFSFDISKQFCSLC